MQKRKAGWNERKVTIQIKRLTCLFNDYRIISPCKWPSPICHSLCGKCLFTEGFLHRNYNNKTWYKRLQNLPQIYFNLLYKQRSYKTASKENTRVKLHVKGIYPEDVPLAPCPHLKHIFTIANHGTVSYKIKCRKVSSCYRYVKDWVLDRNILFCLH